MAPRRFEGAITALLTPMRGGAVDLEALARLVERQLAGGIDGLVACGTTGEAPTLSPEEQEAVIRTVVRAARGRVPVIAGAGSNATDKSIDLAHAARAAGADALLLVTPYYNRPTQDGMVRHFQAIVEAVPLPAILYNVPSRTGCDLLPDTVARLAELPAVVGLKEATGSLVRASQLLQRLGQRLTLLSGDDLTAMPLFAVGARGVISVTSNIAPTEVAAMWDAAADGDFARARALHDRLFSLSEALFSETNPIPVKAAASMLEICADELRAPLHPMSGPARERLRAVLAAQGPL